jgi:hypothetical protein
MLPFSDIGQIDTPRIDFGEADLTGFMRRLRLDEIDMYAGADDPAYVAGIVDGCQDDFILTSLGQPHGMIVRYNFSDKTCFALVFRHTHKGWLVSHRSMTAVFDPSIDITDESERKLFSEVYKFVGELLDDEDTNFVKLVDQH